MASRIKNYAKHILCVDLVGEEPLYLRPGEVSRPLRDEHLAANPYLSEWEKAGVIERIPVRMSEVLAEEHREASAAAAAQEAGHRPVDKRHEKERRRKPEHKPEE